MDSWLANAVEESEKYDKLTLEEVESMAVDLVLIHEMTRVDIKKDTFNVSLGLMEGEKLNYTVTNASENSVSITVDREVSENITFEIIDQNHIVMNREEEDGEICLVLHLKRVK